MQRLAIAALVLAQGCTCQAPQRAQAEEAEERAEPPALPEAREITFDTDDGVRLVGDLRRGADASAPLVVLVHQLGSSRGEWTPLLRWLAASPAMTTFALDMRGHGESVRRIDGTAIEAASFDTDDWMRVESDVRASITHLVAIERITPTRIAVVGSSIGGSAAILAAAEESSISAVVAISPGLAYRGIDITPALPRLGERPVLTIVSHDETESVEAAREITRAARGAEVELVDGDRHGVAMFERDLASVHHIVGFLREHLIR